MKLDDANRLEERLIDFAASVIVISADMPRTSAGLHVANQLLRCGTSPAAHYGEARGAESRADFVHKLRIALKELNETRVWLKMALRSRLASENSAWRSCLNEADQLSRIIGASVRTAQAN